MNKKAILEAMKTQMAAYGWPLQSVCGLPPAFVRDTLVSPYLHCFNVPLRPFGSYRVEGTIGIIHQGFEQEWLRSTNREPKQPGFGMSLHTANIQAIDKLLYIKKEAPLESQIEPLCSAFNDMLESMPRDEHQLARVFQEQELLGLRLDAFAGYAFRAKFLEFREYVSALRVGVTK